MNYTEFKHRAKELGCEIKETDKKIELYYWETGSVFVVSKLFEKSIELPNCIATNSQHDMLDLVLEFSRVPLSDRGKVDFDKIPDKEYEEMLEVVMDSIKRDLTNKE